MFFFNLNLSLAAVIPCVCIMCASYAGKDRVIVVTFFVIAVGGLGYFFAGAKINVLDLCPHYSAPLMTVVNAIGSTCAVISPILALQLTTHVS